MVLNFNTSKRGTCKTYFL